jgi:lipoyl(octanoyl) transferase
MVEEWQSAGMATRASINRSVYASDPIRVERSEGLTSYAEGLQRMEAEANAIAAGTSQELLWLVEHPSTYTAGTSAKLADLKSPYRFPVFQTGRGGQYTYHGPGQRVAYVMFDLRKRGQDVRAFVAGLERVIIGTLADFGVCGEVREDRVGVWVRHSLGEDKIAAIGIRVRKGVSFHGLAINVSPDLSHFDGIVPCGVSEHGVTSFAKLGLRVTLPELDRALLQHFKKNFAPLA